MRVQVDEDVCLGTGCCQTLCPRVFKLVNGVAEVQVDIVDPRDEDRCRDAMEQCPTGAIWIRKRPVLRPTAV